MPKRREFRPVPLALRRSRRGVSYRAYARFYALYTNFKGQTKRASFQVRISPRLSHYEMYRNIVTVCNELINKNVPEHDYGEVFSSFDELLLDTRWFRVRRLKQYRAGVEYER